MAGCYEYGNEPSGSIKAGRFLTAETLSDSQKGLRYMELFN
jgi:hypothetical protein